MFNSSHVLVWSTMFGGSGNDQAEESSDIAVSSNGEIYITGTTTSSNSTFPDLDVTGSVDYYDGTLAGGADMFVSKFGNNFQQLWCTYFGDNGNSEVAKEIDIDASGNIYIVGKVASTGLPVQQGSAGAYYDSGLNDGINTSNTDGFVIKFNSSLGLSYCSYFGGVENDVINAIDVQNIISNGQTELIFAGNTSSQPLSSVPIDEAFPLKNYFNSIITPILRTSNNQS